MKNVFIIHGTWGSPEWNWFPWMKKKLEEKWYTVIIPRLPTPDNQSLESWMWEFEAYKKYVNHDTIFIAHSVWPAFVLHILEQIDVSIDACYFAAWFLELIQLPEFDLLNETITSRQFDWKKIHKNCKNFYMCHGSDDPYVPYHNVEILAENLKIQVDIIEWGWHLNSESGYREFKYLLKKIVL